MTVKRGRRERKGRKKAATVFRAFFLAEKEGMARGKRDQIKEIWERGRRKKGRLVIIEKCDNFEPGAFTEAGE